MAVRRSLLNLRVGSRDAFSFGSSLPPNLPENVVMGARETKIRDESRNQPRSATVEVQVSQRKTLTLQKSLALRRACPRLLGHPCPRLKRHPLPHESFISI